jgi:hypothetical protein
MSANAGKTVAEILRGKRASLKNAPLPKGAPSWDEILPIKWEEIDARAKRRERGYQTIRKLLTDPEYNK